MKKGHLIGIIVIAIAIGAIISTIQDSSTYASFAEAKAHPENTFHVIGVLNKEKELNYDPTQDANYFSFYVIDSQGIEQKVVFNGAKPQDFERSEQIVIMGKMNEEIFTCSKILMKCPSKYNDGQEEVEVIATGNELTS
jgi:cytochrome c-type biogenesis protein CcmE